MGVAFLQLDSGRTAVVSYKRDDSLREGYKMVVVKGVQG
jgi:hypothetical protein